MLVPAEAKTRTRPPNIEQIALKRARMFICYIANMALTCTASLTCSICSRRMCHSYLPQAAALVCGQHCGVVGGGSDPRTRRMPLCDTTYMFECKLLAAHAGSVGALSPAERVSVCRYTRPIRVQLRMRCRPLCGLGSTMHLKFYKKNRSRLIVRDDIKCVCVYGIYAHTS